MRPSPIIAVLLGLAAAPLWAQSPNVPDAIQLDPELKALRHSMIDGVPLAPTSLRRLADAGDGLAAFKFARLLETGDGAWGDILHYDAIALYTGREFATARLVRGVKKNSDAVAAFGTLRRKSIEDALLIATRRGNRDATVALADMYATGVPFGEKPERARALLKPLAAEGDGAAALQVALMAIGKDPARPIDETVAREMLLVAAESPDLVTQSTAKNLLILLPAEIAASEGVTQ